jgi:hypothetical protein
MNEYLHTEQGQLSGAVMFGSACSGQTESVPVINSVYDGANLSEKLKSMLSLG